MKEIWHNLDSPQKNKNCGAKKLNLNLVGRLHLIHIYLQLYDIGRIVKEHLDIKRNPLPS